MTDDGNGLPDTPASAGATIDVRVSGPRPTEGDAHASDPRPVHPSDKAMGLVPLVLDKGIRTTAIGVLYGLDFEIATKGFNTRVFFDHYNKRLKVLDYQAENYPQLVERLSWLADQNGFDKVFLKASRDDWQRFLSLGFVLEGILKYYFRGRDAFVMSRFGSLARAQSAHIIDENTLIEALTRKPSDERAATLPAGYRQLPCGEEHIPDLVRLYRRVFKSYPSPLTHPDYLQQTMRRNVLYRAVITPEGRLASAASAEVDDKHATAELTDCATLHSERSKGLMHLLLSELEQDLRARGMLSGYSFARARSRGMNQVFYQLGYEYTGRLVNSCDIQGQMEDMNLWVKPLSHDAALAAT
jgi:putative beta-lysine N-acetyltransferase